MTQRGEIPDDVYQQIDSNSRQIKGRCDECCEMVKIKREHPDKRDVFICESCYSEIALDQEWPGFNENSSMNLTGDQE